MKKLTLMITALLCTSLLWAQSGLPTATTPGLAATYQQKSRSFKHLSTASGVTGGVLVLAGGIWYLGSGISGVVETNDPEPGMRAGKALFFTGCGLVVASLPLAFLSQKYKEKAKLELGTSSFNHPLLRGNNQMTVGLKFRL